MMSHYFLAFDNLTSYESFLWELVLFNANKVSIVLVLLNCQDSRYVYLCQQ